MCDACGLGTSKKPEIIYCLDSTFSLLSFYFVFVFRGGGGGRVTGKAWSPGTCFVFSFSRFMRRGADDDDYHYNCYYILITIILIIVTCIHIIFVERQQEKVAPTYYYNKGPDATDYQ